MSLSSSSSSSGTPALVGLRPWRHMRGWNQAELAQRVGVSMQTISDWETGRRQPRLGHLQALIALFGQPLEVLFPSKRAA